MGRRLPGGGEGIFKRSRVLSVVLILLLGAMGIGCGDLSNAKRSAVEKVAEAEAAAFAQAVNLRATDVPGLEEMPIPPIPSRPKLQAELSQCAGVANSLHHRIGVFPSHRFGAVDSHRHFLYVLSGVYVWTEPRFAKAQYALNTHRGRVCLARLMPRLARLAPDIPATVHVLPAPWPNIDATEMRLRVVPPLTRRPSYIDLLTFPCRSAEVELVVSTGPGVAKPSMEKRLLAHLYNRARTSELLEREAGSSGC